MPRKLSRGPRLLMTAGTALAAALAAPGVAAAAECAPQPTTAAFAAYGDTNQYFVAPGGAFESLSTWTQRGTPELIGGFNLFDTGLSRAAELHFGEGVTSLSFCVDRTMPHMRFNAKYDGGGQMDVLVTTHYNGSSDTSSGSVSPDSHRGWSPSSYIPLKTDSIPVGEQAVATVSFRSQGYWRVDDVAIDPYRR